MGSSQGTGFLSSVHLAVGDNSALLSLRGAIRINRLKDFVVLRDVWWGLQKKLGSVNWQQSNKRSPPVEELQYWCYLAKISWKEYLPLPNRNIKITLIFGKQAFLSSSNCFYFFSFFNGKLMFKGWDFKTLISLFWGCTHTHIHKERSDLVSIWKKFQCWYSLRIWGIHLKCWLFIWCHLTN